ncbi:hypothetical protein CXF95_08575 [Paraglaciecola sp. MB-3u-78]|nr:hypothetical protein CXF95_08575 [Paraglaciecola sp. MB-3u-78]
MPAIRNQKLAYKLFTVLGLSVLLLTLIYQGAMTFLLILFMLFGYFGWGLILGLCALALVAVTSILSMQG